MEIVLIAGLWLDGSVWDKVAARLEARGHRAVPVTLPGQGDGNTSATLADQAAVDAAAVDAAAGTPMVVGVIGCGVRAGECGRAARDEELAVWAAVRRRRVMRSRAGRRSPIRYLARVRRT